MPIIQHPACLAPAPDTSICRFMDFNKFRDLFANEELYFRRTDLFKETDPSEALPSDEYVRAACGLRKYDLDDERALNNNQAFARQNSEAYFISCWQLFEGETLDMWKTYGNGVAVFSRFDFLKCAVATMLDDIFLGIVHYGEKDMTGYNLIRFLYTKRRCFLKERELRVVLQCYDPSLTPVRRIRRIGNGPVGGPERGEAELSVPSVRRGLARARRRPDRVVRPCEPGDAPGAESPFPPAFDFQARSLILRCLPGHQPQAHDLPRPLVHLL